MQWKNTLQGFLPQDTPANNLAKLKTLDIYVARKYI